MPTFDTPRPIAVTLELGVGDVTVDATDRTDTTVEVRPSDPNENADVAAAEQTRVEYANGHLIVKGPSGWRRWVSRRGASIDVEIGLPAGSRFDVEAGVVTLRTNGDVGEVRGTFGVGDVHLDESGPIDLRSGTGDVSVERVVGKAVVTSGSGGIRLRAVDGPAVVKNSNGDTWIGQVTGEARVSAANGDISIDVARAGVLAKTANGDVRLGEVAAGSAVAQSAFGDLDVGVRDGVAAWLDLHTSFGRVRNDLDATTAPETGEESVDVHASTSYGDIAIHRSFAGAGSDAS